MNIFDKRPLAIILCVILGSFAVFSFAGSNFKTIIAVLLVIFFMISFFPAVSKATRGKFGKILIGISIISIMLSLLYFEGYFYVGERFKNEVKIEGTVAALKIENGRADIDIEVENIDNKPFTACKLKAYISTHEYYGYSVGSDIKIIGTIESFKNNHENGFNAKSYYTARGYSGIISNIKEFNITGYSGEPLSYKINFLRSKLTRIIILRTNSEAGGLLSALFLGDKEYLPAQVKLDFTRTGITHVLALSGMHLVILILGVAKILQKLGMNRKATDIITIVMTILYVAITGFSASMVRAGIMLILTTLLRLIARTHDSITSLCLSVFCILLFEPYAIYDIALWLSAFATLGVIIYGEYQSSVKNIKTKFGAFKSALMFSVFAICATLSISLFTFKTTSLISPIATIVFSFLTEIYLYFGIIVLLFGGILPVGKLAVYLGEFIIWLISRFSAPNFVFISTNFTIVKIIVILTTIGFYAFLILKIKHKKIYVSAITCLFCIVLAISSILTYKNENTEVCIYIKDIHKEQISITTEGEISIIDIANYDSGTAYDLGKNMVDYKLTHIDNYILVKYTVDIDDALYTLLGNYKISNIYLPEPKTAEERVIYNLITSRCNGCRTNIIKYSEESEIKLGRFIFSNIYSGIISKEENKIMFTLSDGDIKYTYLTTEMLSGKTKSRALEIMCESHTVIFGQHGNVSECKFPYEIEGLERIILSAPRFKMPEDTFLFYKDTEFIFLPCKVNLSDRLSYIK